MRIGVSASGEEVDAQTRAYAEYRLFSRLASTDLVSDAAIALIGRGGRLRMAVCAIDVTLNQGKCLRIRARAQHIYDAIDQAVERAAKGVHVS